MEETDVQAENRQLKGLLDQALERNRFLEEELRRLKGRSSKNSSLPPSSDIVKPNSSATPNRGGAVKGHPGAQRQMLSNERVDATVCCSLHKCPTCGKELIALERSASIFQTYDLVAGRCVVTNYQRRHYRCRCCRKNISAPLPIGIGTSPFSPSFQALVIMLTSRYHTAKREVCSLLYELFHVRLSCGAVCKIERLAAERLKPLYEAIGQAILNDSRAINVDETTWRHARKVVYLWQMSNKDFTFYRLDASRSTAARDNLLGRKFTKPIITDRYVVYRSLEVPHQYCLAHLLRDFQAFAEYKGMVGVIGRALRNELKAVFCNWKAYQNDELDKHQLKGRCTYRRKQLKDLLKDGFLSQHPKLSRFCGQLLKDFDCLWTFLRIPGMEPTNNQAERDLRPMVLWRKKSLGTKGPSGQAFITVVGSLVQSLRKQGQSILAFITDALTSALTRQPFPDLYPSQT